jgi:hypothetical protein
MQLWKHQQMNTFWLRSSKLYMLENEQIWSFSFETGFSFEEVEK